MTSVMMPVELVAQLRLEQTEDPPEEEVLLGLVGLPLLLGAVEGEVGEGGLLRLFPGQEALEDAVDDEVGIAADGRGEMGVIRLGQAVVAEVLVRVDGQLERAEDLDVDELFPGWPFIRSRTAWRSRGPIRSARGRMSPKWESSSLSFSRSLGGRGMDPVEGRDAGRERRAATATLAATMNSSMSWWASFRSAGTMEVRRPFLIDELRLEQVEVETPGLGPPRPEEPGQVPHQEQGGNDVARTSRARPGRPRRSGRPRCRSSARPSG